MANLPCHLKLLLERTPNLPCHLAFLECMTNLPCHLVLLHEVYDKFTLVSGILTQSVWQIYLVTILFTLPCEDRTTGRIKEISGDDQR